MCISGISCLATYICKIYDIFVRAKCVVYLIYSYIDATADLENDVGVICCEMYVRDTHI